jgi:hypothetical protein
VAILNPKLDDRTAAFVQACHDLKISSPTAWAAFVNAYGVIVDNEWMKFVDEPNPTNLSNAQGRTKFANVLAEMIEQCSEKLKAHKDTIDAIKAKTAQRT